MKTKTQHINKKLFKCPFYFGERIGVRGFLFYILLFISSFGFSQSEMVKATVDTTNIRIGEQIIYKISVDGTENVIIPKLVLKNLEVVDSLKMDTINNKLIKKYVLTGFDSGAFYIPQQQIFVRNQAYVTDSLLINVATVKTDTTKIKKFPIKGIKSEPYQFDDFKNYLYWIIAALLLIAFLLYYFVFRRKKEVKETTTVSLLSPYEVAMQQLEELDNKLLWQNNKLKEYYSELTDILRTYIENELNVDALESTTDDIIKKLSRLHRKKIIIAPNESLHKLKDLLKTADLVKFAKSKPLAHEIESDRNKASDILNNLKTKPLIVEEHAE